MRNRGARVVLHGALWLDFGGWASRSLMLAHLGLFLLWQPIWRREERLALSSATTSGAETLAIRAFIDGRSNLVLSGDSMTWHHLEFAAPGRWNSNDFPTTVNGVDWLLARTQRIRQGG